MDNLENTVISEKEVTTEFTKTEEVTEENNNNIDDTLAPSDYVKKDDEEEEKETDKEKTSEENDSTSESDSTSEEDKQNDSKKEDSENDKDDEKKKKYTAIENELNTLKESYSKLQEQYQELVNFKKEIDNQKKDALIAEFYMLSDEDKAEIIQNKENYTLDEIKAKLSVICFDKKISFTMEKQEKEEEKIMTYNLNGDEDSNLPEWVKAVKEQEKLG